MEKKLEQFGANLKRWTIKDLELEDADLQAIMTIGITASGTFLNLLKLKKVLEGLEPEVKVIYPTISSSHLRIVKSDHWEEYLRWRRQQALPRFE